MKPLLVAVVFLAGVVAGCTAFAAAGGHAQSVEVADALWAASVEYGVPYDTLARIARCESGYRPWVTNPASGAAGLFQFLPRTWAYAAANVGLDPSASPYDPWAASLAAAWLYTQPGGPRQWVCR